MWHMISYIDSKYPLRSGTMDGIAYTAGLIKSVGWDGVKLEFSTAYATKYPFDTWGTPANLKELAQETPFANLFADPALVRFQFNTFSIVNPTNNPWAGAWNKTVGDAHEQEIYDLACHLLATYNGKEFIIQNWEGDWQLLNSFHPADPIPDEVLFSYRDWHRRRQRAVTRARADTPSTSTIIYCTELNRGLDTYGTRILRDVLANVPTDALSYSAYEVIEGWHEGMSQAALEADIEAKLTKLVALTKKHAGDTPIILGEYGWPINQGYFASLGYDVAALFAKVVSVADGLGIIGEIPWQILDNEETSPGSGVTLGFEMFGRNGNATTVGPRNEAGDFFASIL